MQKSEHTQVGWGYWLKWVGVSVAFFAIIGAVIGYQFDGMIAREAFAIFLGAGGAVIGLILGRSQELSESGCCSGANAHCLNSNLPSSHTDTLVRRDCDRGICAIITHALQNNLFTRTYNF